MSHPLCTLTVLSSGNSSMVVSPPTCSSSRRLVRTPRNRQTCVVYVAARSMLTVCLGGMEQEVAQHSILWRHALEK